jgi:hypothetical protein
VSNLIPLVEFVCMGLGGCHTKISKTPYQYLLSINLLRVNPIIDNVNTKSSKYCQVDYLGG